MRANDGDCKFVKKMQKAKENIVKQIRLVEKDTSKIESPITIIE